MQVATPLKEACTRGDLEIARVLLEAGADPNMQDYVRNTLCSILHV